MRRIVNIAVILLTLPSVVWAEDQDRREHFSRQPFFDAKTHQTSYAGPGREKPPPTDINEVLIGYFGPGTPSHPHGGDMWCAASLAVEEANRAGGYKGLGSGRAGSLPFRLVAGWSDNPWGSGVTQVARMAYVHNVWAVIGGIDGPSTHLAEQVAAKARLTLLSPANTDRTANLANVPWMFSCLPPDHLQAPVLVRAIASYVAGKPFVLVSAVDHDSHVFTVELTKCFVEHRLVPAYHFEFDPGKSDLAELAGRIAYSNAHALIVVAGAQPSVRLIRAVRTRGFVKPIFGGPWMGQRRFLEQAGGAAEGVIFPLLHTRCKRTHRFDKEFIRRFGNRPDYLAAHTYDAVNLLIAAIHQAGLNRARICDAVRALSGRPGVTGTIQWDSLGSNSRPVRLGTIRKGCVQPLPETEPNSSPRFSSYLR